MLPVLVAALCLALEKVGATQNGIVLKKCCDVNEALNGDATRCVPAPWPKYEYNMPSRTYLGRAQFNESWLRRWVPPGLPLGAIASVYAPSSLVGTLPVPVNTSGLADGAKDGDWRPDRVLFDGHVVIRRSPEGGVRRTISYCVDAAQRTYPAPFALRLQTACLFPETDCVATCCSSGEVLAEAANGSWSCALNRSLWESSVAALRRTFDPEVPINYDLDEIWECSKGKRSIHHLPTPSSARARMGLVTDNFFSSTQSCISYIVKADGTAEHVVVHCDYYRWSRAFFRCTRPLCFVSALLLLAALVAIGTSPRLRSSVHGWALGCHAGCLLAFNLLQIAFYLSVSDHTDFDLLEKFDDDDYPDEYEDERLQCLAFALPIYFFLTAANCWLTVICFNMSKGFKLTRATQIGGRIRRFMLLSLFAWGIPIVLTAACASLYENGRKREWRGSPSLVETRTCYVESRLSVTEDDKELLKSNKAGSALYYYAPMAVLSAVNLICVIKTMRRVRILTRGNSVLRTDTKERKKKTRDRRKRPIPKTEFARRNED